MSEDITKLEIKRKLILIGNSSENSLDVALDAEWLKNSFMNSHFGAYKEHEIETFIDFDKTSLKKSMENIRSELVEYSIIIFLGTFDKKNLYIKNEKASIDILNVSTKEILILDSPSGIESNYKKEFFTRDEDTLEAKDFYNKIAISMTNKRVVINSGSTRKILSLSRKMGLDYTYRFINVCNNILNESNSIFYDVLSVHNAVVENMKKYGFSQESSILTTNDDFALPIASKV